MILTSETWAAKLTATLEQAEHKLTVFFRDDDAGWDDAALMVLLDRFAARRAPIDLAVIPTELDASLAQELLLRRSRSPIGLHQHGYQHRNHEAEGRKCEFGPSRSRAQQQQDIAEGLEHLALHLGEALDPIFTPPWNRCTQTTADALTALGFRCLSRNLSAIRLHTPALRELPVAVDWQRQREGVQTRREESLTLLGHAARGTWPLGVMLHHAAMDSADLDDLDIFLETLAASGRVRFMGMGELLARYETASSQGRAETTLSASAARL